MAASLNERATWPQRRNGLRNEAAAKWAMQFAVLASLGAIAAWTILLVSGDPRRSGTFWLIALGFGIWGAPVQAYARWTMLSLWAFLLLWPVVALAALVYNAGLQGDDAVSYLLMGGILGYTVLLSLAGFAALRRSSLPFGRASPALYADGYKPPDALPDIDPQLRSIQLWFIGPLLATIMVMSAVFATVAVMADLSDGGLRLGIGTLLLVSVAEPVLFARGQYQSRRSPGRRAAAFLALAVLQSCIAFGGAIFVCVMAALRGSPGAAAGGTVLQVIALIVVACDAAAWRRIRARALSHGCG